MNHLVIGLIVLYAAVSCEATLFSWGSSPETKEPKISGYSPILNVRKYTGIQIDPIQGPPVYLQNVPNESNNLEGQTTQLSQEQIQQLDLINKLSTFLPEEGSLQEMDLSAVLPYVDLISEDSLESFKNTIELAKPKEKSKLLKIIEYLKYLKDKKLKPFRYVASLGSSIVHKKKNLLGWGTTSTTTQEPYTETTPVTYPTYGPYNPYLVPRKPLFVSSYSTPAPQPALPSLPSQYYPQYPINFQNLPSADQFPPSFPSLTVQKQPNEIPAEIPSPAKLQIPALPQFPAFPPAFQFPFNFPSTQSQPSNSAPAQNPPTQTQYQYQYPALPAQSADPGKNEITYEYKQPPASTYAIQDPNAIRQFASGNQPELPSTPAPKIQQSNEPQYTYQSNQIPSFNSPQQSLPLPKFQPSPWYVASYPNSNQEPNKFYTSSANDLAAAGSENVEKKEHVASDNSNNLKNDLESSKINNVVTSTETIVSKSQSAGPKRTVLRAVPAPARTTAYPVYPSLPKEEILKDDGNKSTSAVTLPTTN